MYDIVALGESLIDFTPAGINEMGMPLFSQNPGGAPANVLAMASKLGRSTAFVGKVGRDAFGRFLQEHMEKAGIDCSALRRDDRVPTTLAFVQLDEYGDRSFSFYRDPGADVMLRPEEVDDTLLDAGYSTLAPSPSPRSLAAEPPCGPHGGPGRQGLLSAMIPTTVPSFGLVWKLRAARSVPPWS